MWASFRVRLLIVIVITTLISLGMQINHNTRAIIKPAISFMLKDYGVEKKLAWWGENLGLKPKFPAVPVITEVFLAPCESYVIDKEYGWYWNPKSQKQEFFPGVLLTVPDNSLVKVVMSGTVSEIKQTKAGRTVVVKHADGLYSYYRGLKEVLVEKDVILKQGEVIGKCGAKLYFELRGEEGALNPLSLFDTDKKLLINQLSSRN